MTDQPRVAVVGGGAVGTTAAGDLAARGAAVTLYERDSVASGASGRAAGIVYDARAEDVDARIAARALDRFRAFDADGRIEFTACPYVWYAHAGDERRAAAIRESVERMRAHGRDVELLDGPSLVERFPALAVDADAVAIGAVAHDAGHLDPASHVRAMAARAREHGVDFRTGTPATLDVDGPAVLASDEREAFDAVVVAAGAHTKRLLAEAGVAIPMKPYRVQTLTTEPLAAVRDGGVPMAFDATDGFYLRPRDGGLLVGGGTQAREFDPDDYDRTADPDFLATARERVRHTLGVDATVDEAWAGLCTATPDADPLLGEIRDGVFVATGWHGSGFMRSPATAERVAEQILGGEGIDAFDPRRFDGDEVFEVVEGMTVEE